MHTVISLTTDDLVAACDELLDAAHSQRERNAIDLAYEMLADDGSHIGRSMSLRVDELDGEYRVESRTTPGRFYDVTVESCTCPAGQAQQHCWHRKYVQILERFRVPVKRQKRTYEKAAIEREMAELFN